MPDFVTRYGGRDTTRQSSLVSLRQLVYDNGPDWVDALDDLLGRAERYEAALRQISMIPHNVPSTPSATQLAERALDG